MLKEDVLYLRAMLDRWLAHWMHWVMILLDVYIWIIQGPKSHPVLLMVSIKGIFMIVFQNQILLYPELSAIVVQQKVVYYSSTVRTFIQWIFVSFDLYSTKVHIWWNRESLLVQQCHWHLRTIRMEFGWNHWKFQQLSCIRALHCLLFIKYKFYGALS